MNRIEQNNRIIVALATPYGRSAVAVIRISGKGSIDLVGRFLSRRLEVGKIAVNVFKTEKFNERLMATCFESPKSYTGEDTVELYPHGNTVICDGIIKTLINAGAFAAEKGEFTKRAFLNGKLDLMQCEALADVIDAQTAEQLVYGNKRYDGGYDEFSQVKNILNKALSSIEAVLHYGDELEENEIDTALVDDVYKSVDVCIEKLNSEIEKFAGGRIINDGFRIALIGEPNVGKSTLLNCLTQSDRAIVTDIAGTTRDTLDGNYVYKDKKFVIIDTAGITETTDAVEKIGVERAKKAAQTADAVVYVTADESGTKSEVATNGESVVIKNKCDVNKDVGTNYRRAETNGVLEVSAKNNVNITALKQKLFDLCPKDCGGICNHRQYECAVRCFERCKDAKNELDSAFGLEIVSALLFDAYSAISELYGEQADEKIIESVFDRFCVGK